MMSKLPNYMVASFFTASSLLLTVPAHAEEVIAEYLTWLDVKDTLTSKGVKLNSFGAVLAQDRANYHRFGVRQKLDTSDPIFNDGDMRAKLPHLYQAGIPAEAHIVEAVMTGRGYYVFVRIMGKNGKITHVNVHEGAG